MPQGLQIWDASGNSIMDTTTKVGTILGMETIGTSDSFVSNTGLSLGTPFWIVNLGGTQGSIYTPRIEVTNPGGVWRISWIWRVSGSASNRPCTLVYGVY